MNWRTFQGKQLSDSLKNTVEAVILKEKANGNNLKVCIGTDSQVYGPEIEFASAIVFIRKGCGAFMYLKNERIKREMGITERMMEEVHRSIQVAYQLSELLNKYNIEFEVHADINTDPTYQSNKALNEAMGYIKGMGFLFKAKPDAFASSCAANRVC